MYPLSNTWCFRIPDDRTLNCTAESLEAAKAVRTLKQRGGKSPHHSRAEQTQIEVLAHIPSDGCTSAGAATSSGGSATWMSTGTALKKHVLDCTIWRRRTMLCLPVHMPTSQRVPPRAATGPDSSVVVLRFIFALAVHTATTTAATVSVKEGADESHRQLGASDCKQRVGQEQRPERRIVLQLLRQPWKRRGQALVASGRKCQVRPERPCLRRLLRVQDELQAARGPRPERRIVLQLLRQPWEWRGALEGGRKRQVPLGRPCLLELLPVRRLPPGREEPGRGHQRVALPSSRAPTRPLSPFCRLRGSAQAAPTNRESLPSGAQSHDL